MHVYYICMMNAMYACLISARETPVLRAACSGVESGFGDSERLLSKITKVSWADASESILFRIR